MACSLLVGAIAPAGGLASTSAGSQLGGLSSRVVADAAAKTKKKTKKKKTAKKCYAYKTVKGRNGKKRRVRVTTKCKAPPKQCVKKKNGKTVYKFSNVYKTVTRHGKKTRVQVFVKVKVKGKKGKNGKPKYKRVPKKTKVPVLVSCSSQGSSSGSGSPSSPGIPVTVTLQPGSSATLDFYQFTKQTPLSGTVKGFIEGSYVPNQTNQLNITGGRISVASVPVFVDDVCNGQVSASIQTDPTTSAKVDPSKKSTTTIAADGNITGTLNLILTLAIDLRHGDNGCNQPYLSTGYTTLPLSVRVFGKLNGLTATLHSPEQILDDLNVCIQPGQVGQPCSGFAVPLPIGFSNDIIGAVTIG